MLLYTLAVDLKSAFPSVPHNFLWKKLSNLEIRHKFINIIKDLYCKANMSVRTKDGLSEKCDITKGVLQGETLSPILYSLYIVDFNIASSVRRRHVLPVKVLYIP